jgi:phage shock protein PspC (stress-responsive transcriptional regulator)
MSNRLDSRPLHRSREGRIVAGVCAGLADYFSIDANIIRVIFAGLSFFAGAGILMYVMAWFIIPEEGEATSIAENLINKKRS